MPVRVIDHNTALRLHCGVGLQFLESLLGYGLVQVLAHVVLVVNLQTSQPSEVLVLGHKKLHSVARLLYSSAGVNARTYLEHDVAYLNILACESGYLYDILKTETRIGVELF